VQPAQTSTRLVLVNGRRVANLAASNAIRKNSSMSIRSPAAGYDRIEGTDRNGARRSTVPIAIWRP